MRHIGLLAPRKDKQTTKHDVELKSEHRIQGVVATIFLHIRKHPIDIKAINQFLVIACKDNILREGEFEYGNQALWEEVKLFPERWKNSKD